MTLDFSKLTLVRFKNAFSAKHLSILFGILAGFSIFYFLYFFGAYGIQRGYSYSGHSHLFRSVGFGLLTLAYTAVMETWLKPKWASKSLAKGVAWYALLIALGSHLIFLLFNFFWNWQEWSFAAYGLIMKEFPLMMVLPLSFYLVLKMLLNPMENNGVYLSFHSENGKDQLKIKAQDFLYANSSENYVTISYRSNNTNKQHLIRKPLKILEEELKHLPEIERVHRSFLVNRHNILAVKQQNGKVYLEVESERLPVSKQYQHLFLN